MQHDLKVKDREEFNKESAAYSCKRTIQTKEQGLNKLVECMALNSASTSSESESEVSEVDSFLIDEAGSGTGSDPEPEFLLSRDPDPDQESSQVAAVPGGDQVVDQETQARLEALLEAAGISRLTGESKQLADPEILRRLTSSVSSALDEAAAALTRMRAEPSAADTGHRSLVAACTEGDIGRVRRLLDEGRVSVHETTEEGESLLSLACSAGYYELAQVLLAMRANVEDRGMKGDCTPLMEAASAGHTDIVRLLIAHGADVNAQSSSGNTPLMYACAGGHEEVVRVLLEAGAHVEDHNENGHTPLMEAASAGHCTVARILLEFGAGINTHSNEFKESALTLACYKGHLEMVRFLLEAGADQEHKTDEMHTALMEASMDGHVEVARLLLDSGAQVNMPADSFESPLTLAACGGHVELAMLLLERGANIEEVNDEGYTPLMEASREGHEEMVALLLSQGADINAQTEETQETALTLACCGGFLEVADFLIKAGGDLELGASTPLMEASQEGHLELVRYLLEAGAGVAAITGTQDTALTYACENGHTDVADLLLQYSAQLEHESEGGRTPLMKAARAGHLCTVQFLISRGADVNKQTTNNDHTPLSLACAGGHLNVVEVLLQQGADPYHKLKDNSTMLIEAAKGGHTNVVQVLIDYPNSLVTTGIIEAAAAAAAGQQQQQPAAAAEPAATTAARQQQQQQLAAEGQQQQPAAGEKGRKGRGAKEAGYMDYPDLLESGFVLEGLEEKGLDAKAYIQTMLRRTEGSSKEEQIYQKEQILAELQRVEKELQEKAAAQLVPSKREAGDGGETSSAEHRDRHRREAGDGVETESGSSQPVKDERQTVLNNSGQFGFQVSTTAAGGAVVTAAGEQQTPAETVIQNINNLSLAGRSLANIPPSERPKAKPSRKIDGKGAKKSQLQAALQQHSQQLAQLQQLQQLNQQLQQQVQQQRQLKQQNQATLAALQQNAVHNQQQLADLQKNVTQLQQLEQTILAQQSTPHNQQQQLQQRVQQILQQKQQLQQQIKQFQQQVEQQLAYTQHASPQLLAQGGAAQPAVAGAAAAKQPAPAAAAGAAAAKQPAGAAAEDAAGEEAAAGAEQVTAVTGTDLNFLMCADQLQGFIQGPGGMPAGIDPSILTSAAFELVQASQALQAVQAVQPLLASESPPLMTPLTQDPALLSSMDPAQIARAVQHCPIPLDSALQVATSGGTVPVGLQYNGVAAQQLQDPAATQLLTDCSQHAAAAGPITNFGHQLLLQPQFAFGPGNGLPVLDAAGNNIAGELAANPAAYGLQLPAGTDLSHIGFPAASQLPPADQQLQQHDKKKTGKKKGGAVAAGSAVTAQLAAGIQATAGMLDTAGYTGHYMAAAGNGFAASAAAAPPGQQPAAGAAGAAAGPVVDLDSETDSNHDTALTLACAGGHEELVNLLLSRGADIEHRDKKGFTPLILAATAGHDKVVEILINHGADIEAQSERTKDTPLSLACSGGRYEVVEILLSRGSNKEHRNVSDYTPLSLAASGGYTNIIKLLLAHGAEINSRTGSKLGISPLMLAAMNGHTAAVKLLLDMGSDINAQIETNRNTALTLACFQGRHEVVSLLLDRKANVEHRAKTGLTPLMEAASGGYTEVGRVLLDKGADVNAAPVPSSRDTALTIAADKGHYRFVELLLSRGAQVDVRNKKGNSSLWLAANGGHLDVVQLLYSAGADIDSQDNRKVSCLMSAFRKGHSKVVKWLVKHVTQFPSDTELTRFIATISDKDMIKKTHQCLEIIRVAKERQASEANKAASILLEELEQEKTREESKKAAAARKREKKKKKKEERKAEKQSKAPEDEDDCDDDEDQLRDVNGDANTEDEKEKTPEIIAEGDSGIDANSQGSGSSNDKDEKVNNKKKKNKKKKDKNEKNNEKNDKNERDTNKENENENTAGLAAVTRGDSKEKSPEEEERPPSQPRVPCTIEGHSALLVPAAEPDRRQPDKPAPLTEAGFIEPPGRKRGRGSAAKQAAEAVLTENKKAENKGKGGVGGAASKAPTTDAGWKEVVRKSKKVSVPSNAISRVIGRGGSNINAIRELSGAHIEVEKQSKGQGDRTILIKGSADATRLANQWISAIIASPDKDLADIVGRAQYKQLSAATITKGGAAAVQTKAAVKTQAAAGADKQEEKGAKGGKAAGGKSQAAAAVTSLATLATSSQATKTTLSFSTATAMAGAKTKPVTSTSFAAIAAGGENNFGIIPTGPPPVKANMSKQPGQPAQPSMGQKTAKAKEESAAAPPSLMAAPQQQDNTDYSPFKTFKMSGNLVNWGQESGPAKLPISAYSGATRAEAEVKGFPGTAPELSKAPGYRSAAPAPGGGAQQPGAGPPPGTWSQAPAPGQPQDPQLYREQTERCNSAPGTPVSPIGPSPIAPPSSVAAATSGANTGSPGSDQEWFSGGGQQQPSMRSLTPDPGDLGWGAALRGEEREREEREQRRHGTGSYGHNSPAKAPGAPLPDLFSRLNLSKVGAGVDPATGLATDQLLSAAAQLSSLSNSSYGVELGPAPGHAPASIAPGIPLPDNPASFTTGPGFVGSGAARFANVGGRFGSAGPGGGQLTSTVTTPIFSQPPLSIPAAGLGNKGGLNPNAPDFSRGGGGGGMFGAANLRQGAAMPPQRPPQHQQKLGPGFGAAAGGYNNYNNFAGGGFPGQSAGGGNLQSLLTNQSINALLSNYNLGPGSPDLSTMSGLNDFSGRTLSELTDLLGPDSLPSGPAYNPGGPGDLEPKFSSARPIGAEISRPIGAERRTGPSPIGHTLGGHQPPQPRANKPQESLNNPFGVWDLPPSYNAAPQHGDSGNSADTGMAAFSSLLPASMSGQTLQPLFDNLSKVPGFSEGLQYNGGPASALLDPPTTGPGYGLSPSLTPSKTVDFSDWGSGAGSAPSSGQKINDPVGFRGDPATVRRNMNALWPKEWEG